MIARPKVSQNEWKAAEMRAWQSWPTSRPFPAQVSRVAFRQLPRAAGRWRAGDCYALCRAAGLFGDALSPSFVLTALERSAGQGSPRDVAHSRTVRGYRSPAEPALKTEKQFEAFLSKLATVWWRGEGGNDLDTGGGDDHLGAPTPDRVLRCFVAERLLPVLAATLKGATLFAPPASAHAGKELLLDAPTLRVAREHDMALRCLFVAYCAKPSGADSDDQQQNRARRKGGEGAAQLSGNPPDAVPLLGVLHFARDFRLLTAARFPPAAVVDRRAESKSSTRRQCARPRRVWTRIFHRASRTRREPSRCPKISRIDFDVTELESAF